MFKYALIDVENNKVIRVTHDRRETEFENLPRDKDGNLLKRPVVTKEDVPKSFNPDFENLSRTLTIQDTQVLDEIVAEPKSLNEVYEVKRELLERSYQALLKMGLLFEGNYYQADIDSIAAVATNAIEARAATVKSKYTIDWYTTDNRLVEHSKTSFVDLHTKLNAFSSKCRKAYRDLKDSLEEIFSSEDFDALCNFSAVVAVEGNEEEDSSDE